MSEYSMKKMDIGNMSIHPPHVSSYFMIRQCAERIHGNKKELIFDINEFTLSK